MANNNPGIGNYKPQIGGGVKKMRPVNKVLNG